MLESETWIANTPFNVLAHGYCCFRLGSHNELTVSLIEVDNSL
jgi:hypothetical protein